jgi:hypothetical protein
MQGMHRNCSGLAAARLPAAIHLRVVETRTAEAIIVKAFAVPGPGAAKMVAQVTHAEGAGSSSKANSSSKPNSSSKAKVRAAEAADMTAEAAHVTAEATHMATAHMATAAASCLRIGRKQTAGQQSARQDYHRSSHHRIVLSVCVGGAAVTVSAVQRMEGGE